MSELRRFDKEHSVEGPSIEVDGMRLYPDGATCESGILGGGMMDPSTDPVERQKLVVKYWSARSERASTDFYDLKDVLHKHAKGAGIKGMTKPTPQDIDELRRLQEIAKGLRSRLAKETARLKELCPRSNVTPGGGYSLAEEIKRIHI